MRNELSRAFKFELARAREACREGRLSDAFHHAERAHVLGQRHMIPHAQSHYWMLRVGFKRRDSREVIGQVLRMAAVLPGFVTGWIPKGNTGGTNVSAFKAMPLPDEFEPLLRFSVARDVLRRVWILLAAIALGLCMAIAMTIER